MDETVSKVRNNHEYQEGTMCAGLGCICEGKKGCNYPSAFCWFDGISGDDETFVDRLNSIALTEPEKDQQVQEYSMAVEA